MHRRLLRVFSLLGLTACALLLARCSPEPSRSELAGEWLVRIPDGWLDSALTDHSIRLRLRPDGRYEREHRFDGTGERESGRWQISRRPSSGYQITLRGTNDNGTTVDYAYRVGTTLLGWRLVFSDAPDHPLYFERVPERRR